ncbi:hypothetical protein J1N35_043109 [Gossypium stocksii]|uniref:Uncharacterized protein n=1 Tax=Gossypium stocksii TaxID=47602 RepID=A0A9D3ZER7_9ROSI|nr:hypothetical protein J1N35_043109 [Gossypium stocksii]
MAGKVAKLDFHAINGARGRFPSMTVYVNLNKPLISQILINGNIYRVEYEYLLSICFFYGRYRHVKGVCTNIVLGLVADSGAPISGGATVSNDKVVVESGGADRSKEYGP